MLVDQLGIITLKVKNKLLNHLKINLHILHCYDEYKIPLPFVALTAHRLKHPMINMIPSSSKCTTFSMKYRYSSWYSVSSVSIVCNYWNLDLL